MHRKKWTNLGECIPLHCSVPVSIYDYEAIGTNEVEPRPFSWNQNNSKCQTYTCYVVSNYIHFFYPIPKATLVRGKSQ